MDLEIEVINEWMYMSLGVPWRGLGWRFKFKDVCV